MTNNCSRHHSVVIIRNVHEGSKREVLVLNLQNHHASFTTISLGFFFNLRITTTYENGSPSSSHFNTT